MAEKYDRDGEFPTNNQCEIGNRGSLRYRFFLTFPRKVPTINELIIREEEDEDDLPLKPSLPEIRNAVEGKKSNALEKLMSKVKDTYWQWYIPNVDDQHPSVHIL